MQCVVMQILQKHVQQSTKDQSHASIIIVIYVRLQLATIYNQWHKADGCTV